MEIPSPYIVVREGTVIATLDTKEESWDFLKDCPFPLE